MTENPQSSNENSKDEFRGLFERLTGIKPEEATTGADGWLFIPKNVELSKRNPQERDRLAELAGPNGWRNNIVNDEYDGWWIKPAE